MADRSSGGAATLRNDTRVAVKPPAGLLLFRRRRSSWDKVLPAGAFARVSRSYIVQVAAIEQIEWSPRTETVVTFGEGVEPLALGRLPGTRLREILGGHAWRTGKRRQTPSFHRVAVDFSGRKN